MDRLEMTEVCVEYHEYFTNIGVSFWNTKTDIRIIFEYKMIFDLSV